MKKEEAVTEASNASSVNNPNYVETVEQPSLPAYTFSWGGYVKAIGTLFTILILLAVVLIILRRKGIPFTNPFTTPSAKAKKGKQQPLMVEQRYQIDQRKSLLVVQFLNKKILLGVTDASIKVLVEEREEGITTHEQNVEDFNVLMGNVEEKNISDI